MNIDKHNKNIIKAVDTFKGNKYSFYCKNCGYTFMSNDIEEVKQAKKNHKHIIEVNGKKALLCPFIQKTVTNKAKRTEFHYFARPSLAKALGWKF